MFGELSSTFSDLQGIIKAFNHCFEGFFIFFELLQIRIFS